MDSNSRNYKNGKLSKDLNIKKNSSIKSDIHITDFFALFN